MGSIHKTPNFFRSKPLFGLDIGKSSLKVAQLESIEQKKQPADGKQPEHILKLTGYGTANFDPSAISDGVIMQPEVIAKAAKELFEKHLIGDVTTDRVALSIPSYRTFTRSIELPVLQARERAEAVRLEAEQYIPMPLEEMYLDYHVISETADATQVLVV